jgi:hypothetical protein
MAQATTIAERVFERVQADETKPTDCCGRPAQRLVRSVDPSGNALDVRFEDGSVLAVWTRPVKDHEEPDHEEL